MGSGSVPPAPVLPPLPDVPEITSPEVREAALQTRRRFAGRRGRRSTILGGSVGAPIQRKTLLGE